MTKGTDEYIPESSEVANTDKEENIAILNEEVSKTNKVN